MELEFIPDVTIPVQYQTPSGRSFACVIAVAMTDRAGGSVEHFREYVRDHDWSGFGRNVYDEARQNPFDPADIALGEWDAEAIDRESWRHAEQRVLAREIPSSLYPRDFAMSVSSDCPGILR